MGEAFENGGLLGLGNSDAGIPDGKMNPKGRCKALAWTFKLARNSFLYFPLFGSRLKNRTISSIRL